ncbi:hypothetical protein D9M69_522300 [compost metagenome]
MRSTPLALTRLAGRTMRPSGLSAGMKRQWALDGVCRASWIQCRATEADESSSPCMAPTTSTRRRDSGATTSRWYRVRPCTDRPTVGLSSALAHSGAFTLGRRATNSRQGSLPWMVPNGWPGPRAGLAAAGFAVPACGHSRHAARASERVGVREGKRDIPAF